MDNSAATVDIALQVACAGTACAFLAPGFFTGAGHFTTCFGFVIARAARRQLVIHHLVQNVLTDFGAKDVFIKRNFA